MTHTEGSVLVLEHAESVSRSIASLTKEALPHREVLVTRTIRDACAELNKAPHAFSLAVIDLELTRESGIEFIRHCNRSCPWIGCIALGSWTEDEELMCAAIAGARGCLYRDWPRSMLVDSLRCFLETTPPAISRSPL